MRRAKWLLIVTIALMLAPSGAYLDPFSGEIGSSLQAKVLYSDGDDDDDGNMSSYNAGEDWDDEGIVDEGDSNDDYDQIRGYGGRSGDDWDDDNGINAILRSNLTWLILTVSL